MSVPAVTDFVARVRRLRVRVEATPAGSPAWLVECLAGLEDEHVIEHAHEHAPEDAIGAAPSAPTRRAHAPVSVALDAWLTRRLVRPQDRAWSRARASEEPRQASNDALAHPARGVDVVLCVETEPHCLDSTPRWVVRFGSSGTLYERELADGATVLEIELVEHVLALDATGSASISTRTLARTRTKASRSLFLSRDRAGWKAAALLARALRRLSRSAHALAECEPASAPPTAHALAPRAVWKRSFARALRRVTCEDAWRLAWRSRSADGALPTGATWTSEHELVAPRGGFYADPFLLEHAGREALFFEALDARRGRGTLACVELAADGSASEPRTVLAAEHHLSYPFVFAFEGEAYMIPETHALGRIELWRAREFPWTWERATTLLEGVIAVDATWFQYAGRFWILACVAREHAPLSEELCAFWSEHPFGPWHAHAQNPIVDDPRGARPAGRLFEHAGGIVRPAQDVSLEYGGRILFQEVLELTPQSYRERTLAAFEPSGIEGARGVHTYDRSARHEVIDVCRSRWKLPRLAPRRRA